MPAKLLYRDAQGRDASVDIAPEGAFLGRAADCIVRTDDAMVSRKNCKISFAGGRWMVEDLGSSNGTFVNDVRIQKQALNHADVVRCGTLQVRFVEVAGAQQPSQPQPQAQPSRPRTMSLEAQPQPSAAQPASSVQVDPLLSGQLNPAQLVAQKAEELAAAAQERDALAGRLREVAQEMEAAGKRAEEAEAELRKARAEAMAARDKMKELDRQRAAAAEELHAQVKVAEELREEAATARDEALASRGRADELADEVAARDRQLERAHEEVQRAKQTADELRVALAELQKTKDEGWRELNTRTGELDHLREVIAEQERILEERRVGLIALETSIKDLRAEKEKTLRELLQTRSERDEARDRIARLSGQVEALEEEHRRLSRTLADGSGGSGEEQARLSGELRDLKVELKKTEADRARLTDQVCRLEEERLSLDDRVAKSDVQRNQLEERVAALEQARLRAEEALAKAESGRGRAEDERGQAAQARELALASADGLRKELERERKSAEELKQELERERKRAEQLKQELEQNTAALARAETADGLVPVARASRSTAPSMPVAQVGQAAQAGPAAGLENGAHAHAEPLGGSTSPGMPVVRPEALDHAEPEGAAALEEAERRVRELEEELTKLSTELAVARGAGGGDAELKRRAEEAYTGINDALSELRTNILLARDLAASQGHGGELTEAIQVSIDRAEDAKGMLRWLREVIE